MTPQTVIDFDGLVVLTTVCCVRKSQQLPNMLFGSIAQNPISNTALDIGSMTQSVAEPHMGKSDPRPSVS